MEAVAKRFGLSEEMPSSVKEADAKLLRAEQRDLMPNDPKEWPIYEKTIDPWLPPKAERMFLLRYEELTRPKQVEFAKTTDIIPGITRSHFTTEGSNIWLMYGTSSLKSGDLAPKP